MSDSSPICQACGGLESPYAVIHVLTNSITYYCFTLTHGYLVMCWANYTETGSSQKLNLNSSRCDLCTSDLLPCCLDWCSPTARLSRALPPFRYRSEVGVLLLPLHLFQIWDDSLRDADDDPETTITEGNCWTKEKGGSPKHKSTHWWKQQLFFPFTCQKEQGMEFPYDPTQNLWKVMTGRTVTTKTTFSLHHENILLHSCRLYF